MLFPYQFYEKSRCTIEERKALIPLLNQMMDLTKKASEEGLISLEDLLKDIESTFFKYLLQMCINGIEKEIILHSGLMMISSTNHNGFELLKQMMILDWVIHLQNACYEGEEILEYSTATYLGTPLFEEYLNQKESDLDLILKNEKEWIENAHRQISKIMKWKKRQNRKLNRWLIHMSNRCVQRVLREISWIDLKKLIWIISPEALEKLLYSVSKIARTNLLKSIERKPYFLKPPKELQNRVLTIMTKLEEQGEIWIPKK